MSHFHNILLLFKICFFAEKHHILFDKHHILPRYLRFLRFFFLIFCYPTNFFTKPKQDFVHRLHSFITSLGPIYIKFGQTLSTRPDLIGEHIAEALRSLQDSLPAFSSEVARSMIEMGLGSKIDLLFSKFYDEPVASASIAQVHKAILINGENVAIKVLRPNILLLYERDLSFLEYLACIITKLVSKSKRLKLVEVIKLFRHIMKSELDLRIEAASASKLDENFKDDTSIYIPKIYWEFTKSNILVMEWVDGISIYDRSLMLKHKIDPSEIALKIAVIFLNQAYRDGFFHADLHPGNIIVSYEGRIILVDFGIIGVLDDKDRIAVAEILYAFLRRDYLLVAKIHHKLGYIPYNTSLVLFAQSCRAIAEPVVSKQICNISVGMLLTQLFQITEEFGMETQPKLLMLQKTMLVVEGIGKILDPKMNIWQTAEPWINKWAIKNLTPEAKLLRFAKKIFDNLLQRY
ncbi:2-polyprenylphenol 6-hydroxylase [Rickettsia endosymbiont of Cardiosporidium cionae]|nr:2-polyprenylphenol 6-hydroxylase [Rickettsia endosymbiont of Cardiosporidium cionae]